MLSMGDSINNWADVDVALAEDFDGSLSGLGVELGANAFNMSKALLALPEFKQEGISNITQSEYLLPEFKADDLEKLTKFQYILGAATSPATKMNEETLTYLNQGQPYEMKIKRLGNPSEYSGHLYRSLLKIVFHERRLQYMGKEQMEHWRQNRPGERILDIDVPLSYGVIDINVDPSYHNSFEFNWDPTIETGVYIRVHCISTEFTAKKHGGEKGVPFRVQVDTYQLNGSAPNKLLHSGSCQVKVFKPKGADRKHKTDRDKMEKCSEKERKNYQPSYECTVLSEITAQAANESFYSQSSPSPANRSYDKGDVRNSPASARSVSPTTPPTSLTSPSSSSSSSCLEGKILNPEAAATQVTEWLVKNGFKNYTRTFQNFSGADLLRMSRDDLIQICGIADGIRLNNALQSKLVRPRLTLYVSQEGERAYHAIYLDSLTFEDLVSKLTTLYSVPMEHVADVYLQGPSGIHILVNDEVVQNIQEQSRFLVEASKIKVDGSEREAYRIILISAG